MIHREKVPELLEMGYESLKNTDIKSAVRFFDDALREDFENGEVLFALKCAQFWVERIQEIEMAESSRSRGDMVFSRWKTFKAFLSRISGDSEIAVYSFKRMAFGLALEFYVCASEDEKTEMGPEFDFRVGRCRKFLGDYESAVRQIEKAVVARKEDSRYLAELADCYMLSGEPRMAKLLFREAFFIDTSTIDYDFLESELIQKLIDSIRIDGFSVQSAASWIPVYGEVLGVLDVKRELKAAESSRLNSSILRMENEIRENPAMADTLKPRLLNSYFWMLDHCDAIGADEARKDRFMQKIRLLDEKIFLQYVS
jgi:tetratricopeptide (TPR) repeat protein